MYRFMIRTFRSDFNLLKFYLFLKKMYFLFLNPIYVLLWIEFCKLHMWVDLFFHGVITSYFYMPHTVSRFTICILSC